MKAGLMEIADVFVINKADRADAEALVNSLTHQLHMSGRDTIPVCKTVVVEGAGVVELLTHISSITSTPGHESRKLILLTQKALRIISKYRMRNFDSNNFVQQLSVHMNKPGFNLYSFVKQYL